MIRCLGAGNEKYMALQRDYKEWRRMELQDLLHNSDTTGILMYILLYMFFSVGKDLSNAEVRQLEMVLGILEWIRAGHGTS